MVTFLSPWRQPTLAPGHGKLSVVLYYLRERPNSCVWAPIHNSWSSRTPDIHRTICKTRDTKVKPSPLALFLSKGSQKLITHSLVIVYSREFLHSWWHSDPLTCPLCPPGDLCGHQCGVGCGYQRLKGEGCSSYMPGVPDWTVPFFLLASIVPKGVGE